MTKRKRPAGVQTINGNTVFTVEKENLQQYFDEYYTLICKELGANSLKIEDLENGKVAIYDINKHDEIRRK